MKNSAGQVVLNIGIVASCPTAAGGGVFGGGSEPGWCLIQGTAPGPQTCSSDPKDGQTYAADKDTCVSGPNRDAGCPCKDAPTPAKAAPAGDSNEGDPIDAASGNKFEQVTDYQGGGSFPLLVTRSYNSGIANELNSPSGLAAGMGVGWASNHAPGFANFGRLYSQQVSAQLTQCPWDPRYECPTQAFPKFEVAIWGADGGQQLFLCQADVNGACPFSPEPGSAGQLVATGSGYNYLRPDGYTEVYSVSTLGNLSQVSAGTLTAVQDPHGLQQTYAYTYTTLGTTQVLQSFTVTDPSGRQLQYNYDVNPADAAVGMLVTVNTPTGNIYYGYDANHNLTTVTYGDAPNSTVLTYEYNDSALPHALTGLKDEDGDEYAAWSYDDTSGKAICSVNAPSGNAPSTATTCIADAGGVDKTVVAYNGDGSADVTEPTGLIRHMTFTSVNGRSVFASVDKRCPECGDTVQQARYDANGHLSKTFDFDGNETDYSIDAAGFEQSRTEAVGTTYQRTTLTTWYTPSGGGEQGLPKTVTEEDAAGNPVRVTTWCYNLSGSSCVDASAVGAIWSQTVSDPVHTSLAGRTTTYTYTTDGHLQSVDGPLTGVNDVTTLYYYPDATHCASGGVGDSGDVCMIKDGKGHKTYINQYSAAGFPASLTDPNGVVTALNYDPRGRLLSRILDSGGTSSLANATTTYTYYNDGLLHTVALPITAAGHAYETYGYDRAHRLTGVVNDAGESKTYTYTYNTTARTYDVEEQRFTSGGVTPVYDQHATRDDALDQLRYTNGLGNVTTLQVDVNGNVTGITDPLGHATTVAYDALNRRQQTQDANGGISTYVYDVFDNPANVTSPRGLNTGYVYDAFGELLSQVSPDTGTTSYDYSGWVSNAQVVKTDGRGPATYTYDALYRVLSKVAGSSGYTYSYDDATSGNHGIGRLASITDHSGSTTYTYNSHGRVATKAAVANGNTFNTTYHYDLADDIKSDAYPPANGTVSYTLDVLGRITGVSTNASGGVTLASNVTYMPFGPVSGLTYGNGFAETRGFDAAYRLTGIHIKNGSTPAVQDWTYGYNDDDTIHAITDNLTSANSQSFGYDPLQRLVSATGAYGSVTIGADPVNHPELSYDPDGNRTQMTVNGVTTTYTNDSTSNRLLSYVIGTTTTTTYGYDVNGAVNSDGTFTYSYNVNERNIKVTLTSSGAVQYSADYNALGERATKTAGTTTNSYAYDEAGHLVAEFNPDGSILKQHIWLGDRPLAYIARNINGSSPSDYKYLHVDQNGTPMLATTSTKAIGFTWLPDPWGNGTEVGGNYRPRFPGQFYDTQTGNMQNWMRDYDPQTGRYLESDPIGLAGGINTYGYADEDPINEYDSEGTVGEAVFLPPPPIPGTYSPVNVPDIASHIQQFAEKYFSPTGAYAGYQNLISKGVDLVCPMNSSAQDKRLTDGEIEKLKDAGIDPEELKGGKNTGPRDLFKDKDGNVIIKPKNGSGPGEPTGVNIKNLKP